MVASPGKYDLWLIPTQGKPEKLEEGLEVKAGQLIAID
jgi:hypothetical protein